MYFLHNVACIVLLFYYTSSTMCKLCFIYAILVLFYYFILSCYCGVTHNLTQQRPKHFFKKTYFVIRCLFQCDTDFLSLGDILQLVDHVLPLMYILCPCNHYGCKQSIHVKTQRRKVLSCLIMTCKLNCVG
jgi:hypothetical protein